MFSTNIIRVLELLHFAFEPEIHTKPKKKKVKIKVKRPIMNKNEIEMIDCLHSIEQSARAARADIMNNVYKF